LLDVGRGAGARGVDHWRFSRDIDTLGESREQHLEIDRLVFAETDTDGQFLLLLESAERRYDRIGATDADIENLKPAVGACHGLISRPRRLVHRYHGYPRENGALRVRDDAAQGAGGERLG